MEKPKKAFEDLPVNSDDVAPSTKEVIGKLLVVVAGETEPVRRLEFVSSLIGHVRSAVQTIMRKSQPREFADLVEGMLINILGTEFDPQSLTATIAALKLYFDKYPRAVYDIQIRNDVALVEQCRRRWHMANTAYHEEPNYGWMRSDAMLADLTDQLVDVCNRWQLVVLPREFTFDIGDLHKVFTPPKHEEEVS